MESTIESDPKPVKESLSSGDHASPLSEQGQRDIFISQVESCQTHSLVAISATLICSVIGVLVVYLTTGATWVVYWGIAMWALSIPRLVLVLRNRRSSGRLDYEQARRLLRQLMISTVLAGSLWAVFPAVLLPHSPSAAAMIAVLLPFGMVSGAAIAYYGILPVGLTFVWMVCAGMVFGFAQADEMAAAYIITVLLAAGLMTVLARIQNRNLRETAIGRLKYKELVRQFEEAETARGILKRELDQGHSMVSAIEGDLMQRELLLRYLTDRAPVAIVVVDQQGVVRWAQGLALRHFGHSSGDLEGRKLATVSGPLSRLASLNAAENSSRPYVIENQFHAVDWYGDLIANPESGSVLTIWSGIDASEPMRLRQLQNQFLSTVNHHLRHPLAKIQGAAELLLGVETLDSDQKEQLRSVMGNGVRDLDQLIRRIATISPSADDDRPSQSGKRVPIARLVEAVREAWSRVADGSDLAMDLTTDLSSSELWLQIEEDSLDVLLEELLNNAWQHTGKAEQDARKPVECTITSMVDHPAGHSVVLKIRNPLDAAISGIPDSILGGFVSQLTTDSATHQRFGLGLYLARKIAARHGGTVNVSHETRYFNVAVTLPLSGVAALRSA